MRRGAGAAKRLGVLAVLLGGLLASCSQAVRLAPTPTLYRGGAPYPVEGVPVAQRAPAASLLYVTDRARREDGAGYGFARSQSMAFGVARMRFGAANSWQAVLAESLGQRGARGLKLELLDTTEVVRWPATPLPIAEGDSQPVQEVLARYRSQSESFQQTLAREMRLTRQRNVVLFIHGYRSSFADAMGSLANVWHFSGRRGVPVLYSWPAGNPGLFGYFRDRESAEFSVYHLKEFLRLVAATPGLERIDLIAHSRGAEVATAALREMSIGLRAAGRDPRRALKIENLILAAPDIDLGIARQRLLAERFARNFGRISVYLNSDDRALALAQWLLTGTRFGRIDAGDLTAADRQIFARLGNVNFVNTRRAVGRTSHSYFRENPAVVSDIVQILRHDAAPGSPLRPLQPRPGPFWELAPDYLLAAESG